jgi:trigger factor
MAPVAPGRLRDIQYEEGSHLRFKAEVEVEPEVTVSDYRGLKLEKEFWNVRDSDVQHVIDDMRRRHAEIRPVDGEAKTGHFINADIQGMDSSGVPIIGQKWEDRWFELGKPPLGDEVANQLEGIKPGEERIFRVMEKVPDGRGKTREEERRYSLRVKSLHEQLLPAIDEAFAKKAGDFESVQAMEQGIRKWLEVERDAAVRHQVVQRLMDSVIRRNDFELPPSLVDLAFQRFLEAYRKDHPEATDEEAVRKQHVPMIEWNLKWQRLWPAIAREESIAVTEDEIEAEILRQVQAKPQDEKRIRARYRDAGRRDRLVDALWEEKVVQFLIDQAKIKETTIERPIPPDSRAGIL